ncbi:MAG: RagB/SusD family nutrient uptake outer membrane protein [Salibacteraceae bacterium]
MKKSIFITLLACSALVWNGCQDALDIPPDDVLLKEDALNTAEDLQMLLNSCYDVLANTYNGNAQNMGEVLGENLARPNSNDDLTEIYIRRSNFFNGTINNYYKNPYIAIYRCNTLLEGVDQVSISGAERSRILGEARFIRAFCYFDLLQKFAQPHGFTADNSHDGVVLRTTPSADPLPRSSVAEVYSLILSDLEFAITVLPDDNGAYASRYAAEGLLAMVNMNINNLPEAVAHANVVLNSGQFPLDPNNARYTTGVSPESVFYIVSSDADRRAGELNGKYNTGGATQPNLTLNRELFLTLNSDTTDSRRQFITILNEGQENELYGWNRYNEPWFNIPLVHTTDLKLLRAEALAELNQDLGIAIQDVNDIIERAYGAGTSNVLPGNAIASTILDKVRYERRLETIGEGTWLYYQKRRGANGENILIRDAVWNCPGLVLQFPVAERTNIFTMNPEGGCN